MLPGGGSGRRVTPRLSSPVLKCDVTVFNGDFLSVYGGPYRDGLVKSCPRQELQPCERLEFLVRLAGVCVSIGCASTCESGLCFLYPSGNKLLLCWYL